MRKQLKRKDKERMTFTAKVDRFGEKNPYKGYTPIPTICLKDVRFQSGELATDHIWFVVGKRFEELNLEIGDSIQFDVRISEYTKGYVNWREGIDERKIDYKLNNPTRLIKIK